MEKTEKGVDFSSGRTCLFLGHDLWTHDSDVVKAAWCGRCESTVFLAPKKETNP